MAAKSGRASAAGKRGDRSKGGATPRRAPRGPSGSAGAKRESWLNVGCGMLLVALLGVIAAAAGFGLVVSSAADLPDQAGLTGRPVLQLRIEACQDRGSGKHTYVNCYGYGDPGSSGVTSEMWMIANADHHYAAGTVVPVRCTRTGGCEATGIGPAAGDVGGLALGVLLLGGVLAGVVTGLRSRFGRGAPPVRWIKAVTWSGVGVAAVAAVSGIVYAVA